jgi:hypothetical protein
MATIECLNCGALYHNQPAGTKLKMCHDCICEEMYPLLDKQVNLVVKRTGFPRGWKFKKVFVHSDGTVYHLGVEQPDLKGTLAPTPIEVKPKKSKHEKQREKQAALVELQKLKKQLSKETRKTYAAKLQAKIKKLQKHI